MRPLRVAGGLRALVLALGLCFLVGMPHAHAVEPDEMLANPALEARAEVIGSELRCLVCRNESIEVSQAGLAHDLRMLVRRRLVAGDTNQQVIDYIHSRYGDFVLLTPPFQLDTLLLWGGPFLIVALGALLLWRFCRSRPPLPRTVPPLSSEESLRLSRLINEGADS
jgi:cytochrome c-type biogenesis protein CcmH